MSEWELTDDETLAIIKEKCSDASAHIFDEYEFIARAAQKKLVDWLREPCHKHNAGMLRLGCAECWRNLREGIYDE